MPEHPSTLSQQTENVGFLKQNSADQFEIVGRSPDWKQRMRPTLDEP
jgi:hypothetical protein